MYKVDSLHIINDSDSQITLEPRSEKAHRSYLTSTESTAALFKMADDKTAITETLMKYEAALNASSTEQVMKLYAPDGVFMAQHFPSAVGAEAVRKGYDQTFAAIALTVKFTIIEVVPVSSEWAFARTSSAGTVKVKAGGGSAEANQELFVMHKIEGQWKIARYCFSTTNSPH